MPQMSTDVPVISLLGGAAQFYNIVFFTPGTDLTISTIPAVIIVGLIMPVISTTPGSGTSNVWLSKQTPSQTLFPVDPSLLSLST